jgi:hypothetical protein
MMLPDEELAEILLQRRDPPEVLGSDARNQDRLRGVKWAWRFKLYLSSWSPPTEMGERNSSIVRIKLVEKHAAPRSGAMTCWAALRKTTPAQFHIGDHDTDTLSTTSYK